MILTSTTDLKKYIPIADSFQFPDFEPYILKAVNTFTRKYVGTLHETLENALTTEENAAVHNEVREHLRNAIANFGYFLYIPLGTVMMDSSGISTVNSDQRKSAEWWQVNDIRRELLRSGHEAMDLLLAVLEANPTVFTDWTTNFSTINNELLVKNATIFNKYYHIFESRQTYLALQASIRQVEDQYIHTMLSPELITELKNNQTGIKQATQIAIHKAIVALTVAKVASVGLFLIDENGMRVHFETLINGRKQSVDSGKTADQLSELVKEQINNGTQYLKLAKQFIEDNPTEFTAFPNALVKAATTGSGYKPYDTKGVFSL